MTKAPKPQVDYSRLCDAVQKSRWVLRKFRQERFDAVKQFVGRHWSEEAATQNIVPVNLIATYVRIVLDKLVSKEPRVMLTTFEQGAKPDVSVMEEWINQQLEATGFATTCTRAVQDALFSIGIIKVALSTPEDAASFGWDLQAGQPYADVVDLDDFVFDTHARDFRQASFIGHRYRCPLAVARKMGYKGGKKLEASQDQPFNLEGDEKISALQRMPYSVNDDEFEEMVDLWEIYLPRYKLIVTLPDDYMVGADTMARGTALKEQEWVGPPCGPYHFLGFGVVPGNAMPKAPIMDLLDLHNSVNKVFRKLLRQSERAKTNDLVQANSEDGERLKNANDGDIIPVNDPKSIVRLQSGGPEPQLHAFGMAMRDMFSWLAGNLDTMGGLSPQAKTATQEKLLADNSNAGVMDMQGSSFRFVSSVLKAICWFHHHHPQQTMKVRHEIQGLPNYGLTRKVGPQQRQKIPWNEMAVKVDPYSLRHQTPEQRAQALVQLVTQLVIPMSQMAQQQGISLDLHVLLTKLGKYMDMPDLAEILSIQEPPVAPDQQQGQGPGPGGMPQETTRNYVRENRSQQTGPSQSTSLQQALLGANRGGQRNGKPQGVM